MKVLVVASYNKGRFVPFIIEQADALKRQGVEIDYYGVEGKGISGYLRNLPDLKRKIQMFHPDVIHAHYGLSGLFANLQRHVPVVTTYHGSDINERKILPFSKVAMHLSAWNIFVSKKTMEIARPRNKYSLLPCGIDISEAQLTSKSVARQKMNLSDEKKYVLFAGAFDNGVKNAPLAQKAVEELNDANVTLLELKGYSRDQVTWLMCASDAFLMTSLREGSPQVIKEAMACGCPIVSVDVGDVKERMEGVEGCFVSKNRDPQELAGLLHKAITFERRTNGGERVIIDGLDNKLIAEKLLDLYNKVYSNGNH